MTIEAKSSVTTNNVPRYLMDGSELLPEERRELDYIDDFDGEYQRFFRYRCQIYDIHEFVRIEARSRVTYPFCHPVEDDSELLSWSGIQTDSHFSGIVVRYCGDTETVIVGSY